MFLFNSKWKSDKYIEEQEKNFYKKLDLKIEKNNNEIDSLKKHLAKKISIAEKKHKTKLLNLKKRYDKKLQRLLNNKNVNIENLSISKCKDDKNANYHQRATNLLYSKYIEEKENIEKKWNLINEDASWTIDNFISTSKTSIDSFKKDHLKKFEYIRSKNAFSEKKQEVLDELNTNLKNISNNKQKVELKKQLRSINTNVYEMQKANGNYIYEPLQVKWHNSCKNFNEKLSSSFKKNKDSTLLLKYHAKDFIKFPIFGCPLYLYIIMIAVVILAICLNWVDANAIMGLGVLMVLSMIIGTIFNKIPIWKTYFGGGAVACLIIFALLGATFNVIPKDVISNIKVFFNGKDGTVTKGAGFLNLYITVLLCGAILTLPKKVLMASFGRYGGLLLSSVAISGAIAYGFGAAMNLKSEDILLKVFAPLYGDGNGGGAIPLSQIAEATGYKSSAEIYPNLLVIVIIANIFMIAMSGILTPMLTKSSKITGNGNLMKKNIFVAKEDTPYKDRHVTIALVLFCVIFILSTVLERAIEENTREISPLFPKGIHISKFAWAIIISLIINVSRILPKEIIQGSKKISNYFTKEFTLIIMSGIGLGVNFNKVAASPEQGGLQWQLIVLTIITCILLLIVPFLLSSLFGMFPFEAMISAGSCMGAMGGSGAVACMTASKRMNLMPYAQISCRIGGSTILIIASPLFAVFAQSNGQGAAKSMLDLIANN